MFWPETEEIILSSPHSMRECVARLRARAKRNSASLIRRELLAGDVTPSGFAVRLGDIGPYRMMGAPVAVGRFTRGGGEETSVSIEVRPFASRLGLGVGWLMVGSSIAFVLVALTVHVRLLSQGEAFRPGLFAFAGFGVIYSALWARALWPINREVERLRLIERMVAALDGAPCVLASNPDEKIAASLNRR